MKKLLIAVLAIAGLASCTNSDVEFETAQKQIGLSPITENRTRAMVSGTAFPEAENFMVWAWYKQVDAGTTIADWQADAATQQLYIDEKPFEPKATTATPKGLWAGKTAYFRPKLGSLLFAGYYPYYLDEYATVNARYEFDETTNVMIIEDYTPYYSSRAGFVTDAATHTEDLMYFNMTPASVNCATTNTDAVDVVFKHALAWIKVTLAKAEDTPDDAIITVSSVKFTDVYTNGTGTVEGDADIVWEVKKPATADIKATTDIEVLDADATLAVADDEGADIVEKQPIVIPQAVGDLVITYTIASEEKDGTYSSFTETKTVKLANDTSVDEWEAGKCYTYAITIGTSEILIDPTVTEWDNVTVPVVH
jgi:hypothetical protein